MKQLSQVKLLFVRMCLLLGLVWLVSACGGPPAAVSVVTPAIGEPKVGAPSPQQPGEEIGISIEIASTGGATLSYSWAADGGEIVRGQGSPAITYRVPEEPGTYNIRVKVEWDGQSVEKVTSVKVEGAAAEATPEVSTDTPEPPADTPTPKSTDTPEPTDTPKPPTATPTPQATNTPKPTNTHPITPTPTLNVAESPFVDNFGDIVFDDSFNSNLWHQAESEKGTTCVITQKDGALFVDQATAFKFSFCGLTTKQNANWLLTNFNQVSARLRLTKNEGDEHGSVNIVLKSNDTDWFMLCHAAKYKGDEPYMNCWTPKWEEPANPGGVGGISLDTWHEFRMKVDPTTVTFEFYIDGYYYASYTPPEAADLKDDSFHIEIGVLGGPKLSTSGWIDDVYIGPSR